MLQVKAVALAYKMATTPEMAIYRVRQVLREQVSD
jgi:hypothetical protein